MLFLLKDDQGEALLMAEAGSKAEADKFGRTHLPEFCGESVEIDTASYTEKYRGLRKVRVVKVPVKREAKPQTAVAARTTTLHHIVVWGPKLPDEVVEDGLLTPEDHRDLTLDHIARTSDLVAHVEIFKRA